MRKVANLAVAAALASCLFAGSVEAQNGTTSPWDFGLTAGVNIATLGGDDVDDAGNLTGFFLGVSLVRPMTDMISFQGEIAYSRKGATANFGGTEIELRIDYIDVPLLAKIHLGPATPGGVRPALFLGPFLGFKVGCEGEAAGISADCEDADLDVKAVDFGLVGGAGIDFDRYGVFARYQFGLASIDDSNDSADAFNRVIQIGGRVSIPLFGR
ncbi:MAG TPA: porin family protein [Gemmatimonadaceae bacterium]